MTTSAHIPVLQSEVIRVLAPKPGDTLLDATLGHGGHSKAYLEATSPSGKVVGFDADPEALVKAKANLATYSDRVRFVEANFSQLKDSVKGGGILQSEDPPLFSHILFDLGLGSHQLADTSRGFSFQVEGPLLMKYGNVEKLPLATVSSLNTLEGYLGHLPDAPEILQGLLEADVAEVLTIYGEERYADQIAQALKKAVPITTAKQLSEIVTKAVPVGYEHGRIHPATRTFQALRLAVNRELEVLEAALPQAVELLKPQGVVAVISFHSLEDRIVKQFFRSRKTELEILTKKPVQASEAETNQNPRARSAKLRAARKT